MTKVLSKRQIPTDTRHENVCLIWERKSEQFLGLWLKTERHYAVNEVCLVLCTPLIKASTYLYKADVEFSFLSKN